MDPEKTIQIQMTADNQTVEVVLLERTILVPSPDEDNQEIHLYRCDRGEKEKVIRAAGAMSLVDENADTKFWGMNIQSLKDILRISPGAAKEIARGNSNPQLGKVLDPRITPKFIQDI